MQEHYELETLEQLRAIADLLRLRIIDVLKERPMTVTQLGDVLGEAPAKVHYHVRELEKVGLLRLVETREKGGILEKYYQPIAREFSVEKSLFSAPLDEATTTLSSLFGQIKEGFLRAFRKALEQKEEHPRLSLGFIRVYLTAEEQKRISKEIAELLKPYEQRRDREGEQEMLATFITYPQEVPASQVPQAAETQIEAADVPMLSVSLGLIEYSRAELEKVVAQGKRKRVHIVGRCHLADDISPELADRAFEQFHLVGKLEASPAVHEVLMKKRPS